MKAPTGTGKSIGIPAGLGKLGTRVYIAVPTRTAAISLSGYLKLILPGTKIGYAAEAQIEYTNETQIVYATAGHMCGKMLRTFNKGIPQAITFTDVLIVDEIHTGSIDNTCILSLWMYSASKGVAVPRLVVLSATPAPIYLSPAPSHYEVIVPRPYPIDVRYYDMRKVGSAIENPDKFYREVVLLIQKLHNQPDHEGDFLVFVPGSSEVESIMRQLEDLDMPQTIILGAYSAMKKEDVQLIYSESPKDARGNRYRKIIISTNLAESAITVDGLSDVIDTMLEKRAETSSTDGFRLVTSYISRDSAEQRCGRIGRTSVGVCHRLISKEEYDLLDHHRAPEVERLPLHELVIRLLDVGLNPVEVIKGIEHHRVSGSVGILTRLKMIQWPEEERTKSIVAGIPIVTDLGHFAPNLPLGVRNVAFLWKWLKADYPAFPGIVLAVIIDSYGPSYFFNPRREKGQSVQDYRSMLERHQEHYFSKFRGGRTDGSLGAYINMWNTMAEEIDGLGADGFNIDYRKLLKWSQSNSINHKKLREVVGIVIRVTNAVRRAGFNVAVGPFTKDGLMMAAIPMLVDVYSDNLFTRKGDYGSQYEHIETGDIYRLDRNNVYGELENNPPKVVVGLITAEIKTTQAEIRIINLALEAIGVLIEEPPKPEPGATRELKEMETALEILDDLRDT